MLFTESFGCILYPKYPFGNGSQTSFFALLEHAVNVTISSVIKKYDIFILKVVLLHLQKY
nr:MAG TPA: hypothetical protein [Caudoviricetes sp.]